MLVRSIVPGDAEQFLRLCLQLDEETQLMLLEPGERTTTVAQQQAEIERILSDRREKTPIDPARGMRAPFLVWGLWEGYDLTSYSVSVML